MKYLNKSNVLSLSLRNKIVVNVCIFCCKRICICCKRTCICCKRMCICCTLMCICCISCVFVVLLMCICCTVCIAVLTSDAGLQARSQNPEGPATGHLNTGLSWFPCVYKRMLRWFPSFQVATTCLLCSPPDLNFLVTFFSLSIFVYT